MSEYVAELKFIHSPDYGKTGNISEVFGSVIFAIYRGISDTLLAVQTGTVCERINDPLRSTARCCHTVHRPVIFQQDLHQLCDSLLRTKIKHGILRNQMMNINIYNILNLPFFQD